MSKLSCKTCCRLSSSLSVHSAVVRLFKFGQRTNRFRSFLFLIQISQKRVFGSLHNEHISVAVLKSHKKFYITSPHSVSNMYLENKIMKRSINRQNLKFSTALRFSRVTLTSQIQFSRKFVAIYGKIHILLEHSTCDGRLSDQNLR